MDKKQLIEEIRKTMPKLDESDPDKELKMALHIYITIGRKKHLMKNIFLETKQQQKK